MDNLPLIIDAGVKLFIALIENLPLIIVEIVKAIPQIIKALVEGFGQFFSTMGEIGFQSHQRVVAGHKRRRRVAVGEKLKASLLAFGTA